MGRGVWVPCPERLNPIAQAGEGVETYGGAGPRCYNDPRIAMRGGPVAGRVFINYRRRESRKEARHLATVLRARFGKDGVFLDESGVDGGANWLQTLERQVAGSTAVVTLIGKDWADLTDEAGNRLIEQPNDFVRFEIAQALLRRIPLLPVLLDGAPMPRPAKLPDNLWPFTQFQAMPLRGESFDRMRRPSAKGCDK